MIVLWEYQPAYSFKQLLKINIRVKNKYMDATLILNYFKNNKIKKIKIENPDPLLEEYLHPGESESIQLANYLKCILVIDEKKGRLIAEQKGIEFLTTVDTILLLLKEGIINFDFFKKNLAKYSADGWLGANIYQKYLEEGKKLLKEVGKNIKNILKN